VEQANHCHARQKEFDGFPLEAEGAQFRLGPNANWFCG